MGEALWSPAEKYYIKIEDDGDLTLKDKDGKRIWHSNTANEGQSPFSLRLQADQNLVLYAGSGGDKKAIWASGIRELCHLDPREVELAQIFERPVPACPVANAYVTDEGNFVVQQANPGIGPIPPSKDILWAILQVGEFKKDRDVNSLVLSRVPQMDKITIQVKGSRPPLESKWSTLPSYIFARIN